MPEVMISNTRDCQVFLEISDPSDRDILGLDCRRITLEPEQDFITAVGKTAIIMAHDKEGPCEVIVRERDEPETVFWGSGHAAVARGIAVAPHPDNPFLGITRWDLSQQHIYQLPSKTIRKRRSIYA